MDVTQINERLVEISERIAEMKQGQTKSGYALAMAQGTDKELGIHIDPLTEWAREMRKLNTEFTELVAERKMLKAKKQELRTCDCNCH